MNSIELEVIYFATTSKVKFDQYSLIFNDYNIELKRATAITSVLIEPQHDASNIDGELLIVSHPLRLAARFIQRSNLIPYMIEDTMLVIDVFSAENVGSSGLPGADTKNWWRNLGAEGLLNLMVGKKNRRAKFICQIGAYLGKNNYCFVRSELEGSITKEIRTSRIAEEEVPRSNPFYFHKIFQPVDCALSLAEMGGEDFANVDYRRVCVRKLVEKLKEEKILGAAQLHFPFKG